VNMVHRHTFLLLWPWSWPHDLNIWTWPRYSKGVSAYQRWISRHAKFRAQSEHTDTRFCCCNLDFDAMTLIYELDLKILKVYQPTKSELTRSRLSKARALQTNRHTHTDRCNWMHYLIVAHVKLFHKTYSC